MGPCCRERSVAKEAGSKRVCSEGREPLLRIQEYKQWSQGAAWSVALRRTIENVNGLFFLIGSTEISFTSNRAEDRCIGPGFPESWGIPGRVGSRDFERNAGWEKSVFVRMTLARMIHRVARRVLIALHTLSFTDGSRNLFTIVRVVHP